MLVAPKPTSQSAAMKDRMASYVKQLLELDEGRQRETLNNLSKYAETKNGTGAGTAAPELVSLSQSAEEVGIKIGTADQVGIMPMTVPTPSGALTAGWGPDSKAPSLLLAAPAKAMDAPFLAPGGKQPEKELGWGLASLQLQQATNVLQAALANWEACLQTSDDPNTLPAAAAGTSQATSAAVRAQQDLSDAVNGVPTPAGLPSSKVSSQRVVTMLEKALSDLTCSLPPEAAAAAQSLLVTAASEARAARVDPDAMKWLTEHLEKQQEASLHKLAKLMQDQQDTAGGSAAGGRAPAPPPGLSRRPAAPPPMPWGTDSRLPQQVCIPVAAAAAGPAFLPVPGTSWWGPSPLRSPLLSPPPRVAAAAELAARTMGARGVSAAMAKTGPQGGGPRRRGLLTTDSIVVMPGVPVSGQQLGETLRMHLRSLIKVESSRVLIVRDRKSVV